MKPCPFCGSLDFDQEATGALEIKGSTHQTGWISCNECGAEGPAVRLTDETPEQNNYQLVRDAWDKRVQIQEGI